MDISGGQKERKKVTVQNELNVNYKTKENKCVRRVE